MIASETQYRPRPGLLGNPWIQAARPKTLVAAVCPVLLGTALAWRLGAWDFLPATLCLAFAVLIQVGTNFANDLFDFRRGADQAGRIGPARMVASGLITPRAMERAVWTVLGAALAAGCALIPHGGWWLLPLGIACVLLALAYTAGPFPLAYNGLGEVFVILCFGLVAVGGTFYVQAGFLHPTSLWIGLGVGALSSNLLVVNNLRDMETDRAAGKRTLAVIFGSTFARAEFRVFFLISMVVPVVLWRMGMGLGMLSVLLAWPYGRWLTLRVDRAVSPGDFLAVLAGSAVFLCLYTGLVLFGLALGR